MAEQPPTEISGARSRGGVAVDDRIGRYRIITEIGQGGFGEVFLAEQTEPVRRQVALKIIKLGMDSREVVARFEGERQALAMMDHPNIARVLDGGATEAGRPYFVMDLVKGIAITEYCDRNRLRMSERLALFADVCRAVQHAHQKGIIHRDIKPSNVLVTLLDGKPVPKVIDFGIAKATNARLTEREVFTEYRQLIGTPEYMSPEQAEASALDIDTRSDIYSLGVLLYELLTGTTPFDSQKLRSAAYGEIQRIIREEEPPRPSTRLSTLGQAATDIARRRADEPNHLRKSIQGDLDWIVMKAMEKDRTRRYETANGLVRDIDRFLKNEPVSASPPSAMYRFRKLLRRHRGAFAAAAIVFVALTLGVVGTTWGMISAMHERERAEAAATRAEEQAVAAQRVSTFLVSLFEASDPDEARGREISARELLDTGAVKIAELEAEPQAQATLRESIGWVYLVLGRFDDAAPLIDQAVAFREAHADEDEQALARALHMQANLLDARGDASAAEPVARRTVAIRRRTHGDSRELGLSLNTLGNTLWHLNRMDEADATFREALAILQRTLPANDPDVARVMHNLGAICYFAGNLADAERFYRQSIAIDRIEGTENHSYATSIHTLAIIFLDQGKYEDAIDLEEESLGIRERVMGPEHWHVALSLTTLGILYNKVGRSGEAETLGTRACAIAEAAWGPMHPELFWMKRSLAQTQLELGKRAEARALISGMIAAIEADERNASLPPNLIVLGEIDAAEGRLEAAHAGIRRAIDIASAEYGPDDLDVALGRAALARVLVQQDRSEEAEPEFAAAVRILREAASPDDLDRIALEREYATLLADIGETDEAARVASPIVERVRAAAGTSDAGPRTLLRAAEMLLTIEPPSLRDPALALALAKRANDAAAGRPFEFQFLAILAHAQHDNGQHAEAIQSQRAALAAIPASASPALQARLKADLAAFESESSN